MLNLTEKYKDTPTLMVYERELRIMNELMDAGIHELLTDVPGLKYIVEILQESYQSCGIFEYDTKDAATFDRFIDLLLELGQHVPWFRSEGLIDTFSTRGFHM